MAAMAQLGVVLGDSSGSLSRVSMAAMAQLGVAYSYTFVQLNGPTVRRQIEQLRLNTITLSLTQEDVIRPASEPRFLSPMYT